MSDQYRSASKTPFKWYFAGGPTLARFFMFSFDIMRKSTIIIFSYTHFWCAKESSRWDGSFEHQKLTLNVIENTILHTTRPYVRSSVRTILLFFFVLRSNISTLRIWKILSLSIRLKVLTNKPSQHTYLVKYRWAYLTLLTHLTHQLPTSS